MKVKIYEDYYELEIVLYDKKTTHVITAMAMSRDLSSVKRILIYIGSNIVGDYISPKYDSHEYSIRDFNEEYSSSDKERIMELIRDVLSLNLDIWERGGTLLQEPNHIPLIQNYLQNALFDLIEEVESNANLGRFGRFKLRLQNIISNLLKE